MHFTPEPFNSNNSKIIIRHIEGKYKTISEKFSIKYATSISIDSLYFKFEVLIWSLIKFVNKKQRFLLCRLVCMLQAFLPTILWEVDSQHRNSTKPW